MPENFIEVAKLIDWRFIRILAKEAEDFPGFIKWKPKEKPGA